MEDILSSAAEETLNDDNQDHEQVSDEEALESHDDYGEADEQETEAAEQPDEEQPQEPDFRAQWEQLPDAMRQRITQAFEAEKRLREAQTQQPQEQRGPQSLADLNDQQFEQYLRHQNQAVRERYYQLMEQDVEAAEELQEAWRDRRLELKHQRAAEINQRQNQAWSQRMEEVAHTLESSPEFESVRWAGPQIVQRAQQLGIDPAMLANELRMFAEAAQQRQGQVGQSRQRSRQQSYTEAVDGGAPPKPKRNEVDDWANRAADNLAKFMIG